MSRLTRLIACAMVGPAFLWSAPAAIAADPPTANEHRVTIAEIEGLALHQQPRVDAPDLVDRILEVVHDIDPVRAERMRVVRKNEPRRFQHVMRRSSTLVHLAALKAFEPDLYTVKLQELRADRNARRVADKLRAAIGRGSGEAESLRTDLRLEVLSYVGCTLAARGLYLKRFEDRIETRRSEIREQALQFGTNVSRKVDALLAAPQAHSQLQLSSRPGAYGVESDAAFFDHDVDCRDDHLFDARQIEVFAANRLKQKLTSELLDRVLQVVYDIDPYRAKRMKILRSKQPDRFERAVRSSWILIGLAELKQHEPELYVIKRKEIQARANVQRAVKRLHEASRNDPGQVDKRRSDLVRQVQTQFAHSLRARVYYLTRLERHIETLQAQIDHEGNHFFEMVDARIDELLYEPVMTAADE